MTLLRIYGDLITIFQAFKYILSKSSERLNLQHNHITNFQDFLFDLVSVIGIYSYNPKAIPENTYAISDGSINDRAFAFTIDTLQNRSATAVASTSRSCGPTSTVASNRRCNDSRLP